MQLQQLLFMADHGAWDILTPGKGRHKYTFKKKFSYLCFQPKKNIKFRGKENQKE